MSNGVTGSTALGNNTLDNFSHGGAYGVTSHTTAMDIFTVDAVGSRRNFVPSVPPPYTPTAMGAAAAETAGLPLHNGR